MVDPVKAAEYRQRASETLALAEEIKNPEQRRMLLSIAAMYHRLAKSLENDDQEPA